MISSEISKRLTEGLKKLRAITEPTTDTDRGISVSYYAEHNSSGPGADPSGRVAWSHQLTQNQADLWAPQRVLRGWTPPSVDDLV